MSITSNTIRAGHQEEEEEEEEEELRSHHTHEKRPHPRRRNPSSPPMPRPYHHPPPPPPPPLPILLPVAFLLSLLALFLSFYLLRLFLLRHRLRRSASAAAQGIDAAAVEAMFPVAAYVGAASGEGEECAVCLTALGAGDGVRVLRVCGHVFHPGCIDPWLKARPTCPVCRSTVRLI